MTEFQRHSIGDYLSVLNNDIPALNTSYLEAIIDIINKAVQVVVYAVVLFVFVDFRIALVILLASLLAVFVPRVTAGELSGRRKATRAPWAGIPLGCRTFCPASALSTATPAAPWRRNTTGPPPRPRKRGCILAGSSLCDRVQQLCHGHCAAVRLCGHCRPALPAGDHRRHRRRNAWLHRELYPAGTVYP